MTRPDYPTEAADGTPHLAYFAEGTSFVWSGNAEHPIQVCPGGYGEPVQSEIWPVDVPAFDRVLSLSLPSVLLIFRNVCNQWLEEHP